MPDRRCKIRRDPLKNSDRLRAVLGVPTILGTLNK